MYLNKIYANITISGTTEIKIIVAKEDVLGCSRAAPAAHLHPDLGSSGPIRVRAGRPALRAARSADGGGVACAGVQ